MIGDGQNSAAAASLTLATLQKGDLVLVKEDGTVVATNAAAAALPATEKVKIAQGLGNGQVKLSSPIQGNLVTKYTFDKYRAPVNQVLHIGFNGTSQDITVADETEYQLNVLIKDDQRPHGQKQSIDRYHFRTDASATKGEVAFGIAKIFGQKKSNGTVKDYQGRFVKLEVLTNGAFLASDNNAVVVNGSKRVVFSTAAEYNTGTAYAAGDIIRLGGTGAGVGVYKIASVSGTTVTLETPYVGTSGTILAANSGHVADGGSYGFQLTALTPVWNGIDTYEIVVFDASFHNANDNSFEAPQTVTYSTKADQGSGTFRQVYDREYFAQGYEGVNSRREWYDSHINPPFAATEGVNYNAIAIEATIASLGDFSRERKNLTAVEIFTPLVTDPPASGEQSNEANEDFVHILNGFFSTKLGFTAVDFS